MTVTAVKQFVATIQSGSTIVWSMQNVNPPFNPKMSRKAEPKWLVEWQAIPLVVEADIDSPGIVDAKVGLQVTPFIVVLEKDTSLSHTVFITCHDVGNPPPGARFVASYALYAIFTTV